MNLKSFFAKKILQYTSAKAFTRLFFLLSLPILFSTCGNDATGFLMQYQRDFEIRAGLGVFDIHVFELNGIPTNKEAFFTANGVLESDITQIIPQNAALSINFDNVEFGFVRTVIVEIFTRDELRGREIFFREELPQNIGTQIDLIPSLPDVKDLLTQDEFNVRIELQLRDISPQFIETRFDFEFFAETN